MNRISRSVAQPAEGKSSTSVFPWDELQRLRDQAHLVKFAKAMLALQDHWAGVLKPPEYRAVEFILRQTLGFGKSTDPISVDQFANGIAGRAGMGVTRSNVHVHLAPILACGLIRKDGYHKGAVHEYCVNLDVLYSGDPVILMGRRSGDPQTVRRSPASETSFHASTASSVTSVSEPDTTSLESSPAAGTSLEFPQSSPAGETSSPASETSFPQEVLPARLGSPASRTYSLKPLRTVSSDASVAFCPRCQTRSWKQLPSGETVCGLCECERVGAPGLRPIVEAMMKQRKMKGFP